jgi:hypothetical protein
MSFIKSVIKKTPVYSVLKWWRNKRQLALWKSKGCPVPPPSCYKYGVIREYATRYQTRLFVETGTYFGEAVNANLHRFDRIYSIELGEELYKQAADRFKRWTHVKILPGDSAKVLPSLLKEIREPAVFWLDGHYSAGITAKGEQDTPIEAELEAILTHPVKGHVILIDDARCFDGTNKYPSLSQTRDLISSRDPDVSFEVVHDIIRVCPNHRR